MANPEATDIYHTIAAPATGLYKEKGSRFLAFAFPVSSEEEVKENLAALRKTYYDARHHCYAYRLGAKGNIYRANDDGEPSHSAGDPILGQLRSAGLTNILVVVVRYFGGTKLGVGGLITAYRSAAADALATATIIQKHETRNITIKFDYAQINEVMALVKEFDLPVKEQAFEMNCRLTVEVRLKFFDQVKNLFSKIEGAEIQF
jgi:uncharacterized YigZ family protein